jgi:c-di-GMP-related signal transduction protein
VKTCIASRPELKSGSGFEPKHLIKSPPLKPKPSLRAADRKHVSSSPALQPASAAKQCFCELLSPKVGKTESDLFLVGLVSMMDAILEVPMAEALERIARGQDTKAVLSGGSGKLRPVYQLLLAQEAGAWA